MFNGVQAIISNMISANKWQDGMPKSDQIVQGMCTSLTLDTVHSKSPRSVKGPIWEAQTIANYKGMAPVMSIRMVQHMWLLPMKVLAESGNVQ